MVPSRLQILIVLVILCWIGITATAAGAVEVRQDTNGDGKTDQMIYLDKEGHIERLEVDQDEDGFFEKIQYYQGGTLVRMECDTDGDHHRETTFYYDKGVRVRAEMDRNGDGIVDCAVDFKGKRRVQEYEDRNGDGRWDLIRSYQDPSWSLVEKRDEDGDGFFEEQRAYTNGTLRRRVIRDKASKKEIRVESYDAKGHLSKLIEGKGSTRSTWTFDSKGRPASLVQDRDGDGLPDLWGYYKAGKLRRLAEDRNKDGRPDMWSEYNDSGKERRVLRDVDYDGKVDINKEVDR